MFDDDDDDNDDNVVVVELSLFAVAVEGGTAAFNNR